MTPIQRRQYLALSRLSSYKRRVEQSASILRSAARLGPLVIASSWGKDSTALCGLALEALGRVEIMHISTPARLPGGEAVEAYFSERATVHIAGSCRSLGEYMEWLHEVGLPHERSRGAQQRIVTTLKRDVGREWCAENGFVVQAMGLRAEEAVGRRCSFRVRGPTYQLVSGLWITCPLAWWSAADVWAFIVSRDLPWHPLYDCETHGETRENLRNTGWLSTDGAERGRIAWLRAHYPVQYEALAEEFPGVRMLS